MDARGAAERVASSGRPDRNALSRGVDLRVRVLALVGLILGLFALPGRAPAADLLILSPASALGPVVERDRVLEPNWILWPPAADTLVRSLSLTTGVDWDLRAESFAVRESGGGQALLNERVLDGIGFFAARRRLFGARRLVPLGRPGGAISVDAIALCAEGSHPVRAATPADLSDPRSLIVATAATGDAIVRARGLVRGRTLLIETPAFGRRWSRFYLFGNGWPVDRSPVMASPFGRAVPGLVPARSVGTLLTSPESFGWVPRSSLLYREADRWLAPARAGWATWMLVLVSLVASGIALFDLATDRRRFVTSLAIWTALGSPAAVLLSTVLASGIGPEYGLLAVLAILGALVGAGWATSRIWDDRHATAALGAIGVLAAAWSGPFHPWSGVLRDLPGGLSPEAVGASAAYAVIGIAATRDGEGILWFVVRCANAAAFVGLLLRSPECAFVLPLGWAAGMTALPASVFPAIVLLPHGLIRLFRGGVDFRPNRLARVFPDEPGVNLWQVGAFFLSPPTALFGLAVAFTAMTAAPYAGYRLRRAPWGPGHAALTTAGGLAAASVLTPELWPAVLVILATGLPLLVADARQPG